MDIFTIDQLQGDPMNPRTISKEDYAKLKKLLQEFGDLSGIVKNVRTGQLVGGHMRIKAFLDLDGASNVQIQQRFDPATRTGTTAIGQVVLQQEVYAYREVDWDEGRQRAANIAANRAGGDFDKDLLAEVTYELSQLENADELLGLTGMLEDEINRLLDGVSDSSRNIEEDEAPEVDETHPPVSKTGEIYKLGRHRLMCGSATDFGQVSDLMDGQEADMIFTDPPYNVAYEGKTADALTIQNDSMDDKQFYEFLLESYNSYAAVTKPGAAIYVCHADSEGMNFRKAMVDAGFLLKQCLIWVKQSMAMGRQDYQWQHEPILYGWKDGASHYFVDDRTQTTIWSIDRPSRNAEHPTMKPIALCAKAIMNSSRPGALVIDFFGGSGSTLIAADETDRTCYTMELDPRYVDVIRKRYHIKATGSEEGWEAGTPVIQAVDA